MSDEAVLNPSLAETMLPAGAVAVPAESLPLRDRTLLDHEQDMTPTMERFHKSDLRIRVMHAEKKGSRYRRRVVLMTAAGRPVLQGLIDIRLDLLPPAAAEEVLLGRKPLGGVLRDQGVPHVSRPASFFTLSSNPGLETDLRFTGPVSLYGRVNHLLAPGGEILAMVVEILPPADRVESS